MQDTKGIFISYRRGDTTAYAGWLADRLGNHFGEQNVFRDIGSVEPGADFVEAIERALEACVVMLVLIGNSWQAKLVEARRTRREDYTRLEIATALKRDVRVIPVLVQGASMPRADELPDDLGALARRHAIELHDTNWQSDIQRLITVLETVTGRSQSTDARQSRTADRLSRALDQLESKQIEVRLEGISALERISKESEKDYWPVMETLTAYVRQHAPRQDERLPWPPRPPDSDIQAIVAILRERTRSYEYGEPYPLDLHGTCLPCVNLRQVSLKKANLRGTLLVNADLTEADLSEAELSYAVMHFANLKGANLAEANAIRAMLGSNLYEAKVYEDYGHTDLSGADLRGANLFHAFIAATTLERSDLKRANLEEAYFTESNLRQANLEAANLREAKLWDADFRQANLKGAILDGTIFQGTNLEGANVEGALFGRYTQLTLGTNLRNTIGLTEEQLKEVTIVDDTTQLPSHLQRAYPLGIVSKPR